MREHALRSFTDLFFFFFSSKTLDEKIWFKILLDLINILVIMVLDVQRQYSSVSL